MAAVVVWCHRHAWWVIAAWLVILVGATAAGLAAGGAYQDRTTLPASESQQASELLARLPGAAAAGDRETVVVEAAQGLRDPAVRTRVQGLLGRLSGFPHVVGVASPYDAGTQAQAAVSADGRTALVAVSLDVAANALSTAEAKAFVTVVRSGSGPGVDVDVAGFLAQRASPPDLGGAYLGLVAAGLVLLVTFGALFSMLMPLVTAGVSVGTAIGVIELLSHTFDVAQASPEVAALIGLGVGVDYSLFLITRHRQGLLAGRSVEDALAEAGATSGRSVLFAGVTVCVALLGMFVVRLPFLYGIAAGSSIAVLLTMAASLSLLPALLRLIGLRVLSRRERRRLATEGEHVVVVEGRTWQRWARFVTRRPAVTGMAALVLVVVLAVPFFSLRLGIPSGALDPAGSTTRAAYEGIERGFGPGYAGPLFVVADGPDAATALDRVGSRLAGRSGVARVEPVVAPPGVGIASLTVYPAAAPDSVATADLVRALRADVVPQATAGTAAKAYVGGVTAGDIDFSQAVRTRLPLFVLVVVAISFVLLMAVFRSLAIPVTAAVMNILAAGVAFGMITAVFQWNWAGSLFGLARGGPIEPYIPVLLFAALFGLSMDYEVFLVGRIEEEYRRRGDTHDAVVHGLAATGRTITAAAGIMVVVFAAFVFGGQRVIQEAGLGLAVAVLVDAVVIRSVLVPAVMALLGRANWWLPRWLGRVLPNLQV